MNISTNKTKQKIEARVDIRRKNESVIQTIRNRVYNINCPASPEGCSPFFLSSSFQLFLLVSKDTLDALRGMRFYARQNRPPHSKSTQSISYQFSLKLGGPDDLNQRGL
jgi:hypothetical protein